MNRDFLSLALVFLILSSIISPIAPANVMAQGPPPEVKFRGFAESWNSEFSTIFNRETNTYQEVELDTFFIRVDEVLLDADGWPKSGEQVTVYWSNSPTKPPTTALQPQPPARGESVEVCGYKFFDMKTNAYVVMLWESHHYLKKISAPETPTPPIQPQIEVAKIAGATIFGGAIGGIVNAIAAGAIAKTIGLPSLLVGGLPALGGGWWIPGAVGGVAAALTSGIARNAGWSVGDSVIAGTLVGTGFNVATIVALAGLAGVALTGPVGLAALGIGIGVSLLVSYVTAST